jgi:flagellar motor switch protein FliM
MSEILSQDEVNALLQGVSEGKIPVGADAPAAGDEPAVHAIDLTSQERSVRGRLPGLEMVIDRFARASRSSLGSFFGQMPAVSVGGADLLRFGAFLGRLPRPVYLQLFKLTPLRGQGIITVTPAVVASLLQVFFGGNPSRRTAFPAREFSPIEQRILDRLGTRLLADLREAWRPVEPLECTLVRAETNPFFATICGMDDLVLHVELRIEVEGCDDGVLALCIPNAALDPVRPRLQTLIGSRDDDADATTGAWRERLRAALAGAEVEVSAELGTRTLRMREVLGLKAGDVIGLGTGREGPVVLKVEGRPRFLGAPGAVGGNNAVQVTARL